MKKKRTTIVQTTCVAVAVLPAVLLVLTARADARLAGAGSPAAMPQRQGGRGHALGADEKLSPAGVTLLPEGFAPGEVSVPAGAVLLSVRKRVGAQDVTLELRAEGSEEVIWRASMPVAKWDLSEVIRLRPGRYSLSAAGNPDWVCRITAEDRS
jgi:hypothetical protein